MKKLIPSFAVTLAFAAASGPARAGEDDPGQDIYNARCATCHGRDGKAQTPIGIKLKTKDLTQGAVWKDLTDAAIQKLIDEGTADKAMPSYKGKFSAEEVAALVKYLHGFQPK